MVTWCNLHVAGRAERGDAQSFDQGLAKGGKEAQCSEVATMRRTWKRERAAQALLGSPLGVRARGRG